MRKVIFNEPIDITIAASMPIKKTLPTYDEIREIQLRCKADGFDENAIVARNMPKAWETKRPINWGIVLNVNTYKDIRKDSYSPLVVGWLLNGATEEVWPEDVVLIHKALSWAELDPMMPK